MQERAATHIALELTLGIVRATHRQRVSHARAPHHRYERHRGAAAALLPYRYWPRRPHATAYYGVIAEHLETMLDAARARSPRVRTTASRRGQLSTHPRLRRRRARLLRAWCVRRVSTKCAWPMVLGHERPSARCVRTDRPRATTSASACPNRRRENGPRCRPQSRPRKRLARRSVRETVTRSCRGAARRSRRPRRLRPERHRRHPLARSWRCARRQPTMPDLERDENVSRAPRHRERRRGVKLPA